MNRRLEREQVYKFVRPRLSREKRILEVGCGQGDLARRLSSDGFEVTGLDREILPELRVRQVQWVEADLFDFRAERTFDAIVVVATLHHLPEDEIGARLAEDIFKREEVAVAEGELLPVGLRFVAQNTRPKHDHEA